MAVGVVVPTPRRPELSIITLVIADEPTEKSGVEPSAVELCIENSAHGDVDAIPTRPVLVIVKRVEVAKALVVEEMVKRFKFAVLLAAKSERSPYGDEVPIPTLPLFATMKLVAEDEPITNCGAPLSSPFGLIDS